MGSNCIREQKRSGVDVFNSKSKANAVGCYKNSLWLLLTIMLTVEKSRIGFLGSIVKETHKIELSNNRLFSWSPVSLLMSGDDSKRQILKIQNKYMNKFSFLEKS